MSIFDIGINDTLQDVIRKCNYNFRQMSTGQQRQNQIINPDISGLIEDLDNEVQNRISADNQINNTIDDMFDSSGKLSSSIIPSYVDDVIEAYPRSGATELSSDWLSLTSDGSALEPETGKVYILLSNSTNYQTNTMFRWTGTAYVELSSGGGGGSGTGADIYLYDVPVGTIIDYGGTTLPSGYLECDGSAVSRTTYADLFAAIGTTWGAGDGSTTFNLPNLGGKTVIGKGSRSVGNTGGSESESYTPHGSANGHTLTVNEMPSHSHEMPQWMWAVSKNFNQGTYAIPRGTNANTEPYNSSKAKQTQYVVSTGGGQAHSHGFTGTAATISHMQPYAVVRKIIRATNEKATLPYSSNPKHLITLDSTSNDSFHYSNLDDLNIYPTFIISTWSESSDPETLPVTPCFVFNPTNSAYYYCNSTTVTKLNGKADALFDRNDGGIVTAQYSGPGIEATNWACMWTNPGSLDYRIEAVRVSKLVRKGLTITNINIGNVTIASSGYTSVQSKVPSSVTTALSNGAAIISCEVSHWGTANGAFNVSYDTNGNLYVLGTRGVSITGLYVRLVYV